MTQFLCDLKRNADFCTTDFTEKNLLNMHDYIECGTFTFKFKNWSIFVINLFGAKYEKSFAEYRILFL